MKLSRTRLASTCAARFTGRALIRFWALLKRGIIGTYHNVSKKYLPMYLNEFQWRFNHRKDPDIFLTAIAGC